MGKLKLYCAEGGPASRAVMLSYVRLTILPISRVFVEQTINSHAGENKTPEYIKMNLQSTVPTLDDNGKIIWDSHAITRYLESTYEENSSLCPKDPYQRAVIDQRLHFDDGILFSRFGTAVGPVFRGTAKEFDKDAMENLYTALDTLEIFVKDNSYVAGNNLTVADFSLISTVTTINKFV